MYRWLAENLGNVSVNRKLGIGFGLVLLLTLLITVNGWSGMSGIISRGDKLGYISSLNELTKDLRLARLDYEARRGEQGPGAVTDLLNDAAHRRAMSAAGRMNLDGRGAERIAARLKLLVEARAEALSDVPAVSLAAEYGPSA